MLVRTEYPWTSTGKLIAEKALAEKIIIPFATYDYNDF